MAEELRVFISFSAANRSELGKVKGVVGSCRAKGVEIKEVFVSDDSLGAGNWSEGLRRGIEEADVFLVIWSSASRCSPGQLIEIGAAWWQRKLILPILYDTCPADLPWTLPMEEAIRWSELGEKLCRFLLDLR